MMFEIATERLKLIQFKIQDLDELYVLYSHPKVIKYLGQGILKKAETKARMNIEYD